MGRQAEAERDAKTACFTPKFDALLSLNTPSTVLENGTKGSVGDFRPPNKFQNGKNTRNLAVAIIWNSHKNIRYIRF